MVPLSGEVVALWEVAGETALFEKEKWFALGATRPALFFPGTALGTTRLLLVPPRLPLGTTTLSPVSPRVFLGVPRRSAVSPAMSQSTTRYLSRRAPSLPVDRQRGRGLPREC